MVNSQLEFDLADDLKKYQLTYAVGKCQDNCVRRVYLYWRTRCS